MKKLICFLIISATLVSLASAISLAKVYSYNFPKAPAAWGQPVSLNNLSPGFFQVMFVDKKGIVRIATYGIEGGAMDELKSPQLVMVFAFNQEGEKVVSSIEK